MPIYEYRCDGCGSFEATQRGDRVRCPNCGASARRNFGFRKGGSGFTGHYNVAAGRYVRSEGELRSAFAEASDAQSKLTGSTVDIQPVDYGDRDACGITDADVDRLTEEKAKASV